jgi:acetyltransferase
MLDIDFGDLIDYFGMDIHTRSIVLYIESITDARKFMSATKAFARAKPIIVIKSGRYKEGAKAAASHTGALAGEDVIYEAAFRGLVSSGLWISWIYSTAPLFWQNSHVRWGRTSQL